MRKDGFIIYLSFYPPIKSLSDEQLGRLFRAIFEWQMNGNADVSDDIAMAFAFFVERFKADREKYEETCERRKEAINSRWSQERECQSGLSNTKVFNCIENIQKNTNDTNVYNCIENIQKNTNNTDMIGLDRIGKDNKRNSERKSGDDVPQTPDPDFILPFDNSEFLSVWDELRQQPKWRRKTKAALQMSLNKLARYDVAFAIELMQQAIANNNQGVVFQDTPKAYRQWLKEREQKQNEGQQSFVDASTLFNPTEQTK